MINRFLLIGTGFLLAGIAFLYSYERSADGSVVVSLDGQSGSANGEALAAVPTRTTGTVQYACADGRAFAVTYGPGAAATISIDGGSQKLDPVVVSSGAEYSDGVLTFFTHGELAQVMLAGETTYDDCRVRS